MRRKRLVALPLLEEHELGHVANGIGFAQDMLDTGCTGDMETVLAPWRQADIDFDAETNNGFNDGDDFVELDASGAPMVRDGKGAAPRKKAARSDDAAPTAGEAAE